MKCGKRKHPPHRLYSARAPIHPKRPYGLTRPVVPPDGSFLFSGCFQRKYHFSRAEGGPRQTAQPGGRQLLQLCWESEANASVSNAAMLPCDLTVEKANNPVFVQVSLATACPVMSRTGQRRSFPQNK